MAIRFDNSADGLLFDTGITAGPVTIMFWLNRATDTNAYQCALWAGSDTTSAYETGIFLGTSDDGTTPMVIDKNTTVTSSNPATYTQDTWYHVAYVGTTDNPAVSFTVYINDTASMTGTNGSSAVQQRVQMGQDNGNNPLNGRVEALKIYTRQLTLTQIQTERPYRAAQDTSNLWQEVWLTTASDLNDRSGNGRNFTAQGTLSTETGPDITDNPATDLTLSVSESVGASDLRSQIG